MANTNKKEIIDILSKLENYEREESKLIGEKTAILKQIKERFDVKNIDEARDELDNMDEKNDDDKELLDKKIIKFKKKYEKYLIN